MWAGWDSNPRSTNYEFAALVAKLPALVLLGFLPFFAIFGARKIWNIDATLLQLLESKCGGDVKHLHTRDRRYIVNLDRESFVVLSLKWEQHQVR